jgi:uncharacterized protein Yka (UPF0111/DUF47 family)
VLERLFPDERKFYGRFTGLAGIVSTAATALAEAFDQPERLDALATRVPNLERQVLESARSIDHGTERMLVAPMDREDAHILSTRLRRVMDIAGATAKLAASLRITERNEHAVVLARLLLRAVAEVEQAIAHLRNGDEVLARCRAIKGLEERGDTTWETAVAELFEGTSAPLDVLRWMSVYTQLEDALDACEDVANELETITVKHA